MIFLFILLVVVGFFMADTAIGYGPSSNPGAGKMTYFYTGLIMFVVGIIGILYSSLNKAA